MSLAKGILDFKDDVKRRQKDIDSKNAKKDTFVFARFCLNIFYTLLFLMCVYIVIVSGTIFIPMAMGFIIGSFGYNLSNNSELLLSAFSGLFFTTWVFVCSFYLIRCFFRRYLEAIRKGKTTENTDSCK